MCVWDEKLSHDYDGKRFVVDGDIIELYAYECGNRQTDVAEQFHAESLEAYESWWLHDWTEHHDNMLRRTCDALESENAELKRAAERDADVLESLNLSLEESQDENTRLRELLRDLWRFTRAACKRYPRLFDTSAQGGQMVQLNAIEAFEQRMRELRIEAKK